MGRDLLYKPPQVTYIPEEEGKAKKDKDKEQAKAERAKAQAKVKAPRDLGHVGRSVLEKAAQAKAADAQRAHNHAYFNEDVSGVGKVNLNKSNAKALRGSEQATNLKKIVIPPAVGIDHPEPGILQGAMDLMGVAEGFVSDLADLLGRQGAWAKGKGVTLEMLEERLRQLEDMVEARKAALGRMAEGKSDLPITSATLLQAATVAGGAMAEIDDVATAGNQLIERTAGQAKGLHKRLAKMFGVKIQ